MSRARSTGIVLIATAAIEMLLFLYGAARRSYLSLALPMTVAMLAVSVLTAWVGWTMMTMPEEEDEPPVQPGSA